MNPVERRIFIKSQLQLRGLSFAAIARQEGVNRISVGYAASGGPSARLQQALADAIGLPVQDLFPERYDAQGQRISAVRPRAQVTRSGPVSHGQKARAA
jgi:lambda repressor-like predicted transcriptional regulator